MTRQEQTTASAAANPVNLATPEDEAGALMLGERGMICDCDRASDLYFAELGNPGLPGLRLIVRRGRAAY